MANPAKSWMNLVAASLENTLAIKPVATIRVALEMSAMGIVAININAFSQRDRRTKIKYAQATANIAIKILKPEQASSTFNGKSPSSITLPSDMAGCPSDCIRKQLIPVAIC